MENKGKKKSFFKLLAAVISVILVVFVVWAVVPHRVIPAGAEDITIYTHNRSAGDPQDPDSWHNNGQMTLGTRNYILSDEGIDKLLELLKGCTMKMVLWGSDDPDTGTLKAVINMLVNNNGKTGTISILSSNMNEVIFSGSTMSFPGSVFAGTVGLGRINNVDTGEFYDSVKAICTEYGTLVSD